MVFKSKVDRPFLLFIGGAILLIALASGWPLFLEGGNDWPVVLTLVLTFILSAGLIAWCSFAVRYEFTEGHLLVKGGPFRSKIPYETITSVAPTRDILTGYRLLSSIDALELFYSGALLGSVKVSPKDKARFLEELKKYNPDVVSKDM